MPNKLFSSKVQSEAHAKLEEILASKLHPLACCMEDPNDAEPYGVYDGPPEPYYKPPDPVNTKNSQEEAFIDRLAEALLKKMSAKVQSVQVQEAKNGNPSPG